MVDHGKRKKHHDRDKYYRLAKEQGLRSRAAFKLSQMNRKYHFLETAATAVLDLCAAPGGWTQIAARTCGPAVPVIAVDILPIRAFKHQSLPNVTTLIGDITTDKCKADIKRAIVQQQQANNNNKANNKKNKLTVDVVLHDGAPNIGAEYGKDAYVQNELTLHAVKCAVQHLRPGGTFVTKVYRSADYYNLLWTVEQLFGSVETFKPAASRTQSSEIFWICQDYRSPAKIDPRLLDPAHVFERDNQATVGGHLKTAGQSDNNNNNNNNTHVLHKNWEKMQNKRQRGGYDMDHYDASMQHITPVRQFIRAATLKDAIHILSVSTGLSFQPSADDDPRESEFLLHHPLTTREIKQCVADLQVLNKADFKGLLTWRTRMIHALEETKDDNNKDDDNKDDDDDDDEDNVDKEEHGEKDSTGKGDGEEDEEDEDDEEKVQEEIEEMRQRRLREKKRLKKKERALASKRRRRAALGMDLNAIDIPEHDKIFSLASINSKGALEAISEVNLDQVNDDQVLDQDIYIEEDEKNDNESDNQDDDDDQEKLLKRREAELDAYYEEYLSKNKTARAGTRMAKRSKKLQRLQMQQEAEKDEEMFKSTGDYLDEDMKAYAQQLQGPKDDDDDDDHDQNDDDDDDDGYETKPMTPEEHEHMKRAKRRKIEEAADAIDDDDNDDDDHDDLNVEEDGKNPLLHQFADESATAKTARWFSNPLFASIGKLAEAATRDRATSGNDDDIDIDQEDDNDGDDEQEIDNENDKKDRGVKNTTPKTAKAKKGLDAEEVLAAMPRTDKEIRHERRLKRMARDERKKARKAKRLGEAEEDFELAPADDDDNRAKDDENESEAKLPEKVRQARELIKAGLGKAAAVNNDDEVGKKKGFEVVSAEETARAMIGGERRPLPALDDRQYNSENEDYDSDDYAQTLALGTMILRRSKEKALVDASYNRYAWNDPVDLPDWFVDDERKNYRPQLPIPPALMAKMKERMMALAAKPIAKVAEARARKNRRLQSKLAAAKKKAEAVANSADMSESMKLRAISKALRNQDTKYNKGKPSKTYVVAKKGRTTGGKGIKLVDKRMKCDKRAMERKEKLRKKGKQNGLVGSKKRRHHS